MAHPTSRGDARESNGKREAILAAALTLFHRYGFRKTSVDALAAEAQVSKPTVYAHFADKDALFAAVCDHVLEGILSEAQAAAQTGALLPRLTAVLAAKFSRLFDLVHSSPHAAELLSPRGAAAAIIAAADARYLAIVVEVLRAADRAGEITLKGTGLSAEALARQLLQVAHGAGYGASDGAAHRAQLGPLLRTVLRAIAPAPARAARRGGS